MREESTIIGLGARLRRFRLQKGWSKRTVAERLGVSPPSISRWEKGEASPNDYNRFKIERLMGENPTDSPPFAAKKGLYQLSLFMDRAERIG